MSQDVIIHIEGLTKRYKDFVALNNLHLDIYRGEIFGYLGPNGAGKTTTIRMLLDLIRPNSGKASIFGHDVHREATRIHERIGNLPGELSLYDRMTGWELIHYLGGLRGGIDQQYVSELGERLDIDLSRKIKTCSSGMKRKIGLIQSLMHKPDLLILDEPTIGLDPLVQQTFYQIIREATQRGTTVFMSSHNLPEVEHVCDRVGILKEGILRDVQTISDLKQVHFHYLTLTFSEAVNPQDFAALPGVSDVKAHDHSTEMRVTGELDAVIKAAAHYHVVDMHYQEPNLEDIFLEYYGESEKELEHA